jgi:hypothetical protein
MPGLLLSRVSPSRNPSVGTDDYDVVGPDGWVIGRIFRRGPPSSEETAWIWSMAFGFPENHRRTYGRETTREAALDAFAKSWEGES